MARSPRAQKQQAKVNLTRPSRAAPTAPSDGANGAAEVEALTMQREELDQAYARIRQLEQQVVALTPLRVGEDGA